MRGKRDFICRDLYVEDYKIIIVKEQIFRGGLVLFLLEELIQFKEGVVSVLEEGLFFIFKF